MAQSIIAIAVKHYHRNSVTPRPVLRYYGDSALNFRIVECTVTVILSSRLMIVSLVWRRAKAREN